MGTKNLENLEEADGKRKVRKRYPKRILHDVMNSEIA
jgi:hypothetical protein